MLNKYEIVIVWNPQLNENLISENIEKIKKIIHIDSGEITKTEVWGIKKLAYPIKKFSNGNYVYLQFNTPPQIIKQLNEFLQLNENILRYLIIRLRGERKRQM